MSTQYEWRVAELGYVVLAPEGHKVGTFDTLEEATECIRLLQLSDKLIKEHYKTNK